MLNPHPYQFYFSKVGFTLRRVNKAGGTARFISIGDSSVTIG
jgi:hypothetical protein